MYCILNVIIRSILKKISWRWILSTFLHLCCWHLAFCEKLGHSPRWSSESNGGRLGFHETKRPNKKCWPTEYMSDWYPTTLHFRKCRSLPIPRYVQTRHGFQRSVIASEERRGAGDERFFQTILRSPFPHLMVVRNVFMCMHLWILPRHEIICCRMFLLLMKLGTWAMI